MRRRSWGAVSWIGLCLLLAGPAWVWPPIALDHPLTWPAAIQPLILHPDQGWHQTLSSWWSTAWVHGSAPHLYRNLGGVALLAALGWTAGVSWRATVSWALAWPLTHVGMLWRPELTSYIGLSGVLHAGAAIIATHQILTPPFPSSRRLGAILLTGLALKIIMENPWGAVLILSSSSAIKVAPWAHFSGVMAGLVCGTLLHGMARLRHPQFKRQ
ncbi:MAG: hypothetical protein ACM3VZ_12220 [Acidobacteriota bacterium]